MRSDVQSGPLLAKEQDTNHLLLAVAVIVLVLVVLCQYPHGAPWHLRSGGLSRLPLAARRRRTGPRTAKAVTTKGLSPRRLRLVTKYY